MIVNCDFPNRFLVTISIKSCMFSKYFDSLPLLYEIIKLNHGMLSYIYIRSIKLGNCSAVW